jgi:hypothetical protein
MDSENRDRNNQQKKNIDRRQFLKGVAVTGTAAAFAGLVGCNTPQYPQDDTTPAAGSGGEGNQSSSTVLHTWEKKPDPITDIAKEKDFDVVIVGAGISGNSAAEAASREGAKVVVIEQSETFSNLGMDCAHIGSKWQKEHGIDIDPEDATRLLYRWSQQTANRDLIYQWATRSGKVFDYLIDLAEQNGLVIANGLGATAKVDWAELDETWRIYNTPVTFVNPDDGMFGRTKSGQTANYNLMNLFYELTTSRGSEYFFKTRARQLVTNNSGAVTGVIAEAEDGSFIQFNASKGVILATGDFGGNQEMVDYWCPIWNKADAVVYPVPEGNLGDGILMGMWVGAAASNTAAAPMVHPVDEAFVLSPFYMSWLTVNLLGERYGAEMPYEPYITNARMVQPGNVGWNIFDSDYPAYVEKQWPTKFEYFLNEGSTYAPGNAADILADRVAEGSAKKADTLDGLADQLGIPADALVSTVERYNQLCADENDVDFGVLPRYLTPVKTPPFYANNVPAFAVVIPFGLHVNKDSQVCTEEDEPISGLFAVGNMQGDFLAYTYPVICPGLSVGRGITYGQLVGEALAHDTLISKTA